MTPTIPKGTIYVTGNVNVDLIMGPLGIWPKVGTEIMLDHSETRFGGAAGNTALALDALGVKHRLIASVGDDIFGRWLRSGFNAASSDWIVVPGATTISVGIVDPGGERTFITSQGHLSVFGLADVLGHLPSRAAPGDILHLQGCFLSRPLLDSYEALLDEAVARGFSLALDTGWPPQGWSGGLRERVIAWLARCDHLMINDVELEAMAGEEAADPVAALRASLRPNATLIVKGGAHGARGYRGEETAYAPAPKIKALDTIGAGDVFDAGYLAAVIEGADLPAALRAGVATASTAISTSPRRYR
ncbi:MAG TPA: carbohydrate kinase family protein [Candidatus Cybelea sp.]|nr:carbohydrate kinase family protein [Candidatus Cybelea sp.]